MLLCHFLAAPGQPRLNSATVKSPSVISRFLNHYDYDYDWNLRTVVQIMRRHALEQYFEYRQQFRGRRPRLELIVDLTSLGKEGRFTALTGWMHTLNGVGMNPPDRTTGQDTSPGSAGTLTAPRRSPDARTESQPGI